MNKVVIVIVLCVTTQCAAVSAHAGDSLRALLRGTSELQRLLLVPDIYNGKVVRVTGTLHRFVGQTASGVPPASWVLRDAVSGERIFVVGSSRSLPLIGSAGEAVSISGIARTGGGQPFVELLPAPRPPQPPAAHVGLATPRFADTTTPAPLADTGLGLTGTAGFAVRH